MTTPHSPLIIDTNILIDLHTGGILSLLFSLQYVFIAPDVIVAELREPPGSDLLLLGLQSAEFNGEQVLEVMSLARQHSNIAINDLFALVLAVSRGLILLTGDRRLRDLAIKHNLDVHGTLWVLDEMVNTGVLKPSEASRALRKILDEGGRLPKNECEERLSIWGRA